MEPDISKLGQLLKHLLKHFDLATICDSFGQVLFAAIINKTVCTTEIYVLHTITSSTIKHFANCCHKMERKNIACWKSRKIVERGTINSTYTHVHDSSLFWLVTGTSIKIRVGVNLL